MEDKKEKMGAGQKMSGKRREVKEDARERESERSANADRWQPRCIAAEAHVIAVNHGRASDTHASTVDTSQYTQAGGERMGAGREVSGMLDLTLCTHTAVLDHLMWSVSAVTDVTVITQCGRKQSDILKHANDPI